MSNYVKELEQFYEEEKLRQLPEKCHKCECTEMTWDLKGTPVWRCMYIECVMEEPLSISGEKGDKQK